MGKGVGDCTAWNCLYMHNRERSSPVRGRFHQLPSPTPILHLCEAASPAESLHQSTTYSHHALLPLAEDDNFPLSALTSPSVSLDTYIASTLASPEHPTGELVSSNAWEVEVPPGSASFVPRERTDIESAWAAAIKNKGFNDDKDQWHTRNARLCAQHLNKSL